MEIKYKDKKDAQRFIDVPIGDCFYAIGQDADRLFMRIPCGVQGINAVSLSDGELEGFDEYSKVYRAGAHVMVTAIR